MNAMAEFALNQQREKESTTKPQRQPIHPPTRRLRHIHPEWIKCDRLECGRWRWVSMILPCWTADGAFSCTMLVDTTCDVVCDWCGLDKCDLACKKM
jgi:hypothetical protein